MMPAKVVAAGIPMVAYALPQLHDFFPELLMGHIIKVCVEAVHNQILQAGE